MADSEIDYTLVAGGIFFSVVALLFCVIIMISCCMRCIDRINNKIFPQNEKPYIENTIKNSVE